MKFYKTKVRARVPQKLTYTFFDETNTIIDLTNYPTCKVMAILDGQVKADTAGQLVGLPTAGTVTASLPFPTPGVWQAQFVAYDTINRPLYGEPIQVKVAANEDDVLAGQPLPSY